MLLCTTPFKFSKTRKKERKKKKKRRVLHYYHLANCNNKKNVNVSISTIAIEKS